jgi:hypothetical protein
MTPARQAGLRREYSFSAPVHVGASPLTGPLSYVDFAKQVLVRQSISGMDHQCVSGGS